MNQIVIDVELSVDEDVDVLCFKLDETIPNQYTVNLNDATSQSEMKNVFSKLLELLIDSPIELNLIVSEGYTKGLYKDVSEEYIKDLNRELTQVREQLLKELA